LLVRAQANPVSGPAASVDVDTSETRSPVCGTDGNHLNEATGGAGGETSAGAMTAAAAMTGGGVTVNVTGSLLPVGFPSSELAWVATAVYCPLDRAGVAPPEVHWAPVPVAVAIETTVPFAVAPA